MCNVSLNIWVCSSLSVCAFDSWEYTVYCGVLCLLYVIILSKFQPNMVLLSGLIFTCPVPSPTFTLRVKSAVLREFTQTTKVCEQKTKKTKQKNRITWTIHLCKCMIPWWVSCMYDMIFIIHWKVSSRMDDMTFSVTTDAFHCDIFKPLIWIVSAGCC